MSTNEPLKARRGRVYLELILLEYGREEANESCFKKEVAPESERPEGQLGLPVLHVSQSTVCRVLHHVKVRQISILIAWCKCTRAMR
jgi:hypothetical protein